MVIQNGGFEINHLFLGPTYLFTLQRHYLYLSFEKNQLMGIASDGLKFSNNNYHTTNGTKKHVRLFSDNFWSRLILNLIMLNRAILANKLL